MKPKKSLGQNFLHSTSALKAIIHAATVTTEVRPPYKVLEIGPGKGFLTEALLQAGASVIAVEKDDNLFELLQEKFASEIKSGQLELIHDDILDFAPKFFSTPQALSYQLVANIPYYLTGEIIRVFLEADRQPRAMVLMLQKEVAERIIAKDGRESILSISVKIFGEPKYLKTVRAGSFFPKPKVDSAILLISDISRERLAGVNPEKFFEVLRAGFAHKRKILSSNLKQIWPRSTEVLEACKINPNSRAENLNLNQWQCLAQKLSA